MKRSFLAFILLSSYLSATPFPHIRLWEFAGSRTVIAGSRTFFSFTPKMAFNFTVNPSTDVFTVTGGTYTPVNGDLLTPDSTGTLPAGMYTITDGYWPNYAVCNVSGATFQLRQAADQYTAPNSCTGTLVDVASSGTGVHTASLYTNDQLYLDTPTGFPAGTTFTYMVPSGTSECNHGAPTSNGKVFAPGGGTICVVASVPSNATPGTMTTHFTECGTNAGSNCATFDWVIDVVAPPNVSSAAPTSFSAIPGLATWEGAMVAQPCPGSQCGSGPSPASSISGPANYCYPLANPTPHSLGAATSSTVSFYGWNLLFDNMAIYTGNSVYRTGCFAAGMGGPGGTDLQGVKYYVTANNGSMIGYAHFTESLFRAARVFNDSSYFDAGMLMKNNYIISLGPKLALSQARENAYGLDDAVALSKYGGYDAPKWADVRDGVYALALRATESDASGVRYVQQAFILSLMAHAIIADWQVSGDNRAPYVIKRIADRLWANYDQANHVWMNLEGPSPSSPWCTNNVLWFTTNSVDSGCGQRQLPWQSLQMMAVQAFWWYYAYAGDTAYRDRGDDFFAHAFDQGGLTGKQASEVYYDSFNAVGWRNGTLKTNQWYGDAQVQTASAATCDLNADGHVNVLDVQLATNQALGSSACTGGDLNADGRCTIVDVMRIVNASLGATCNTAP